MKIPISLSYLAEDELAITGQPLLLVSHD